MQQTHQASADAYEKTIRNISRSFILSALAVTLTLGTLWGVIGLTRIASHHSYQAPDYASIQAHGHAQVFGWVGLFIMGVAYAHLPRLRSGRIRLPRLAWGVLALMLTGIVTRGFAQPRAEDPGWATAFAVSSFLELAAILTFAVQILFLKGRGAGTHHFFQKWLYAGIFWLVLTAALDAPLVAWMASHGMRVVPEPANTILLNFALYGFIGSFIIGMGFRLLPGLLWVDPPRKEWANIAFVIYQLGVLGRIFNPPLMASSLALLAAAIIITMALRIFEERRPAPYERAGDQSFVWYIRLAFFWLLTASLMVAGADIYQSLTGKSAPHEIMGAYRHAITVGFVTTLTLGVASRLVPLMLHTSLNSVRMMRWTFWLIAIGNTMRVGFQILTLTKSPIAFGFSGMSGYLELAALTVFAINITRTVAVRDTSPLLAIMQQAPNRGSI